MSRSAGYWLTPACYSTPSGAATVGYKLAIEGASIQVMPVWGPLAGLIVVAPLLFIVPLFMFTKQLYRTEKRALDCYQEKAMERAMAFEQKWLHACSTGHYDEMGRNDLAGFNNLNAVYDRIHKMRVVPFDARSFGELVGSAMGPLIPLIPYLIELPDPWHKVLEELRKLLLLH